MGMFDSLYVQKGGPEWQTKAYRCNLDRFEINDQMPWCSDYDGDTYQVEVLGDGPAGEFVDAFATVLFGVLSAVGVERDPRLPLVDYCGSLVEAGTDS